MTTTSNDMACIKTGHITTMEQQKARSQQRNGLGIALVGRLADILYIDKFFLCYIVLFSSETSAPARPGTTCICNLIESRFQIRHVICWSTPSACLWQMSYKDPRLQEFFCLPDVRLKINPSQIGKDLDD